MNRHQFLRQPTQSFKQLSQSGVMRSRYQHSAYRTVSFQFSDSSASGLHFSSRGLDMCLLAVCSCALSLMCHQTSGLINLPSVTSSTAMNPASGGAAQVDFVVKAGLVTSRQDAKRNKRQNA